ncbi:apolipoprotein N-acyltransferase [Actinomycetes bacterium KLBMP 9797]
MTIVEPAQVETAPEVGSAPRPLPLVAGIGAAVAGGVALLLALPPYGVWWLAPAGVALLAAAVHRRRPRGGAGLGMLAGLALFLPLLSWTNLHTGFVPWLLLATLQAGFLALLGTAGAYLSPLVDRHRWLWPPAVALLWVAQEALRDRAPYGGFPWGRLAFSQDGSPLVRLAAVGGAPLVTFGVALTGGLLVTAGFLVAARRRPATGDADPRPADHAADGADPRAAERAADGADPLAAERAGDGADPRAAGGGVRAGGRGGLLAAGGLAAGAVAVAAAGLLVPLGTPGGDPVTVAVVQGNVPRMGLDFNAQRRAVLENHVDATLALADRVAKGQADQPDLVVWPENASDIDPLRNADAAVLIDEAAAAIKAPILVGAVLQGPGSGQIRNVGLLWQPGSGVDEEQMYVKRHPVPFGEYMPLRRIARLVTTEVDRVRDMVAGERPGVIRTGPVVIGDVICFEVAYDEVVRDTVTGGAGLLVVQTNNATFDEAEARQQLAMVRLRAVEHGREALMASTVGVSGFVDARGRVHDATGFNTDAVIMRQMAPSGARTLATRLGYWPEVVLVALFAGVAVAGVVVRRRARVMLEA